ncbi:Cyanate permease [Azospirillum sp. RU38E]|nr:Cyanate permease [Azospirillum sp. RU38E]SNS37378.1 Cyanate permease [Azospirillum sp. RU37A]
MQTEAKRDRVLFLVILAGALVISAALGARQTFGLFLAPISQEHAVPLTLVALAVALHNLTWGFAQPFAGALADRFGAAPVIAVGALALGLGLAMTALFSGALPLILGMGLLVGLGISCTSFGVVMTAVGKRALPEQRSMAMGIVSAGGSVGQVLMVPLAQMVQAGWGMQAGLLALVAVVLAVAPLGLLLDGRHRAVKPAEESTQTTQPPALPMRQALLSAWNHPGYRLLTLGFFTCGFQLAFIGTHLPGYLQLCHMPAGLSATALALIGLFNMAGSWICGWLGGHFRQHHVLGWLYLLRGAAIALFVLAPKTEWSVMLFAAVMGMAWLGTVPLTSGLIARFFGVRHLGTLFGICFMSHQVGSFIGAWAGGVVFDLTGSYDLIWAATALSGAMAAALHFPIKDRPGPIATQPA